LKEEATLIFDLTNVMDINWGCGMGNWQNTQRQQGIYNAERKEMERKEMEWPICMCKKLDYRILIRNLEEFPIYAAR
jgi:hypothetical protein